MTRALGCILALAALRSAPAAAETPRAAVFPFYGSELAHHTAARSLSRAGFTLVDAVEIERALSAARSCTTTACAKRIARRFGASVALTGSVRARDGRCQVLVRLSRLSTSTPARIEQEAVPCPELDLVLVRLVRAVLNPPRPPPKPEPKPEPEVAPPPEPEPVAEPESESKDDNLAYNAFLRFLAEHGERGLPADVSERRVIEVRDRRGQPLPNASVIAHKDGVPLLERISGAAGRAMLFPSELVSLRAPRAGLWIRAGGARRELELGSLRGHHLAIELPVDRAAGSVLDVAFVLDATRGMQGALERLREAIEALHARRLPCELRLGAVAYRDRGDEAPLLLVPFTRDAAAFAKALASIEAGGGGDRADDVQAGLHAALTRLEWRAEGLRLAFVLGASPPHLDYGQPFTYVSAMHEAARRGIELHTLGARGLGLAGELVWRQLAQYTGGRFVALDGAASGLEPAITDAIERALGRPAPAEEPLTASPPLDEREAALDALLGRAVARLVDYAVLRIVPETPVVLLPVPGPTPLPAWLGRELERALALHEAFTLVAPAAEPAVLDSVAAQLAERPRALARLVGAPLVVLAEPAAPLELSLHLVSLEAGERLSTARLRLDAGLAPP